MDGEVRNRFTEGRLLKELILFIIPIVITNLLQTLYHSADMIVVSLSKEANAVGAIGTTGSFLSLILNTFIGFSIGANVVVARGIGANDKDSVQKAVHTSLLMAVIFGAIGGIVGISITKTVLQAMGNRGSLLTLAVRYAYIYCAGLPFVALTNYLSAIFRAKGNAKFPLLVLSLSGLVNVIFNLIFVLALGMSVEGVAIATVISNAVSCVAMLIKLRTQDDYTKFSFRRLKMNGRAFKEIVRVGLPAGIQGALFSLSNMLIQSSIVTVNNNSVPAGTDYQPVVNGNAAAGNMDSFAYTSINAVTQGAITFTGQNMGAKKPERIRPIMYNCFLISAIIGVVMSWGFILLRHPFLALYGLHSGAEGSLQQLAYETATKRLLWVGIPYLFCGFMDNASGVLRGLGRSLTSTVIALIGSCLLRVVWTLALFPLNPIVEMVYVCYPISWILTAAVSIVIIRIILKDLIKQKLD